MSWSDAFRARLANNDPRRHRVRSLPPPTGITNPGLDWTLTAGEDSLGLAIAGGSTAGAHLSVPDWSSSIGQFSISLVGVPDALQARIWKGQFVVHEVSFDGQAWEPVQLGIVDELTGDDEGNWELSCLDGLAALASRYTVYEREQPLFALYGLTDAEDEDGLTGARAYLDEVYNPANEASLSVQSNTQNPGLPGVPMSLVGDMQSGRGRLAVVRPTSDKRFYYRYTGMTGTTTLTGGTDDVYGTRARTSLAGAVIQTVCFIEDHPCNIFRKIIASNGRASDDTSAPANGSWNTLPRTWGFGIPDALIDHEDLDAWLPLLAPPDSSGSPLRDMAMLTEFQQPDALGYLQGWFARLGCFLTIRQGRYTLRGVVDPAGMSEAASGTATSFGRLGGQWVEPGSLRWSSWGGSGKEYHQIAVYTASRPAEVVESTVRSHPSEWEYPVPVQDTIWSNQTAHARLLLQRLAPWVLTLCERLEVAVTHPLAKGLAVGDILLLDFAHWGGRDVADNGPYDGRQALVVGVDPDWFGDAPTKLVLATPPPSWWSS